MIYKTFEEWMKNTKNIDVTIIIDMPGSKWDKYFDEYNAYKEDRLSTNKA